MSFESFSHSPEPDKTETSPESHEAQKRNMGKVAEQIDRHKDNPRKVPALKAFAAAALIGLGATSEAASSPEKQSDDTAEPDVEHVERGESAQERIEQFLQEEPPQVTTEVTDTTYEEYKPENPEELVDDLAEHFPEEIRDLLQVDPGAVLEAEANTRDEYAPEMKREQLLNAGVPAAEAQQQYEQMQSEGTERVELQERQREEGGLRSVYDRALALQHIYDLMQRGEIDVEENADIRISSRYETKEQIIGDLDRSLRFLGVDESELEQMDTEEKQEHEKQLIQEYLEEAGGAQHVDKS